MRGGQPLLNPLPVTKPLPYHHIWQDSREGDKDELSELSPPHAFIDDPDYRLRHLPLVGTHLRGIALARTPGCKRIDNTAIGVPARLFVAPLTAFVG